MLLRLSVEVLMLMLILQRSDLVDCDTCPLRGRMESRRKRLELWKQRREVFRRLAFRRPLQMGFVKSLFLSSLDRLDLPRGPSFP
jgi:hypothetical protein